MRLFFTLLLSLASIQGFAGELRIAVASNFLHTTEQLAELFEQQTGHQVRISSGSTGKLYTQIISGAPYDLFMAADSARPQRLVSEGFASADSLTTYALGKLVLWSLQTGLFQNGQDPINDDQISRLAIANPKTAPYGLAAQQAIDSLNLLNNKEIQIVQGENIGQTYQLVYSGAAQAGLIAYSLYLQNTLGSVWLVPPTAYQPIEQQMVIINNGRNAEIAEQWINWLKTDGKQLIQASGYDV